MVELRKMYQRALFQKKVGVLKGKTPAGYARVPKSGIQSIQVL